MKDSADRYFELLPVLLIALIMLAAEYHNFAPILNVPGHPLRMQRTIFTAPRAIFR